MLGLLAGLLNAQGTGRGGDVDVSLHDTAISMLNYLAIWMLNRDYVPQRLPNSAHPTICPAQVFETRDGYLVVFCAKEKFWLALTEALDEPALASDPRYSSFASRYEHRESLIADLEERFLELTTEEWLARMRGKVPCASVNSVEEALTDQQVLAREMVTEVEHPVFGNLRQVRTAIRVPGAVHHRRPAPALGADTDEILTEILDYTDDDIASLREVKAI